MFKRRIKLFTAFGVSITVDWSWLILAFLIVSTLSASWFPFVLPNAEFSSYLTMGIMGALGIFASIVIHELSHAVVGRSYGMPINEITLFLFGGVAHLEDEPPSAKVEFQMAIAGPLASVFLAAGFYGTLRLGENLGWLPSVQAVLSYLMTINLIVAIFNMLPGYPLDGGRVLRSILWGIKKNITWATKIASGIGQFFGYGLVLLGVIGFFGGNIIGGIWFFFLGMMLANFAKMSYVQLQVREALRGRPAGRFMNPVPVTVSPETTVSQLVFESIRDDQLIYPVVDEQRDLLGCVDVRRVRDIPESEWQTHLIRDLIRDCPEELEIMPDADAERALTQMSKTGNPQLMVVDTDHRLLGVVSQKMLMRYLSIGQQVTT